jgi:hypothetical protein
VDTRERSAPHRIGDYKKKIRECAGMDFKKGMRLADVKNFINCDDCANTGPRQKDTAKLLTKRSDLLNAKSVEYQCIICEKKYMIRLVQK